MDVITFPTSGLSILLHGVISLPDATSYDKEYYRHSELISEYNAVLNILQQQGLSEPQL